MKNTYILAITFMILLLSISYSQAIAQAKINQIFSQLSSTQSVQDHNECQKVLCQSTSFVTEDETDESENESSSIDSDGDETTDTSDDTTDESSADDDDTSEDDDDDDDSDVEIVIGWYGEEGYLDENGVFRAFVTFEDFDLTLYKYLSEEENSQVGEWFDNADTDSDTYLSFEEWDTALSSQFGYNCYQSFLFLNIGDGIMGHVYKDQQLSLHEVECLYDIYLYSPYYQQVEFLFMAADTDLDGYITEDDFANITLAYGDEFDLEFDDVDTDADGQVSVLELMVAFDVDLTTITTTDDEDDDDDDDDSDSEESETESSDEIEENDSDIDDG